MSAQFTAASAPPAPSGVPPLRRRDAQQWILDWVIQQTGREQNFEYGQRRLPPEVKSHAMIPAAMARLGHHCETIAQAAHAHGHRATARDLFFRAVEHYHIGQHAIVRDDDADKQWLYKRLTHCFDSVIELSAYRMERVEIPWEGVTLAGVLHLCPGDEPRPTVLFLPGMDMCKELIPKPAQNVFLERGLHVLALDGPGQGVSNIRKIRVDADNYERAASAALDYLLSREEVDSARIGLAGVSMGSHWSMRSAAADRRFAAVASAASCYAGMRHIFEESSPRFKQVFMYMAGMTSEAEFDAMAARMVLTDRAPEIRCPCLMVTGQYDPLSPLAEGLEVFEHLGGPREIWVLENDFHGTGRDGSGPANLGGMPIFPALADWLRDALVTGVAADHDRRVLVRQHSGSGPYSSPGSDFTLASMLGVEA